MATVARSAIVAYSSQQMFDLINDIESYPHFLAGCVESEILSRDDNFVEARLTLGKSGIQQSFVTRNELLPPGKMVMRLKDGPFKSFEGTWRFQALNENACKVSLDLEFSFKNPILAMTAGKFLEEIANRQVDSLCRRADELYS
jgi:ribosome-associated toxin RatA of RatAB toxin-antitoxin module